MTSGTTDYRLSQLQMLEAESVHIFREVAAELERPVLLFSGGKDSLVMLRLAEKSFWPARIPFPLLHIDTGHNFQEVLDLRDTRAKELGVRLEVGSVQESIDAGRVVEQKGKYASRNQLQTTTLLDTVEKHQFDALFGGGRRDEEKARAKERVFSFRDEFGQWDPKVPRPELWNLYNGRINRGESIRRSRCRTGPSSTSGTTSPRSSRAALHLLRTHAVGVRAERDPARQRRRGQPPCRRQRLSLLIA